MIDKILQLIYPDTEPTEADKRLINNLAELQAGKLAARAGIPIEDDTLGYLKVIPDALEYIIIETVIARFNRLGTEGMQSKSVDGLSINYGSSDDLKAYQLDIDYWKDANKDELGTHTVRFY